MTPFHVGMMVVCVGNGKKRPLNCQTLPIAKGSIVTIREIKSHPSWNGIIGLLFEEVTNSLHSSGWEYSYDSTGFRPIVKTDISIFTAMLAPGPKKRVDA